VHLLGTASSLAELFRFWNIRHLRRFIFKMLELWVLSDEGKSIES
jgi:hypothetical protein